MILNIEFCDFSSLNLIARDKLRKKSKLCILSVEDFLERNKSVCQRKIYT